MKIVIKSEPRKMLNRQDVQVYDIDPHEFSVMIDVDFEMQKEELEDPLKAVRRHPQEIINERISRSDINNFRKFKDNTSSMCVKSAEGDYVEREITTQSRLNHHKRPSKDKAKDPNKYSYSFEGVPRRTGKQANYYYDPSDENNELLDVLQETLATLDESQQQLITQVFFEGRSQVEVAEEEGVSKTAIHNRLQRIFKKLKKEFEKRGLTSPFLGD